MKAVVVGACLLMLGTGVALCLYRVVRGPTLPDRVVALDLAAVLSLLTVVLLSLGSGEAVYLDVAVVMALLSFLGTVAFARYLELVRGTDER